MHWPPPAEEAPQTGNDWIDLIGNELPIAAVTAWTARPDCGAQVLFTGTVRDHSDGREDVSRLDYEAYSEAAMDRLEALAAELRRRFPGVGRVALLHRVGALSVGEAAVVVAVCAPHRAEAFEAARFGIDTLKATVPIWKRETWAGGQAWGLDAGRDAPAKARS